MRRSLLFGFLLMIAGLGVAVFTAFMFVSQATVMARAQPQKKGGLE